MKNPIKFIILLALLAFSVASNAQQPPQQIDPAQLTEYLKGAQAHMLKMQDLSNKILAEKDPQKQQALKDQQLELMRDEYMQMMQNRH